MSKRLCKLNRHEINANLGEIYTLVAEAKYLCRSCSRSSSDSSRLCKPTAIPPKQCQDKPVIEKQQCAVLAETLASSVPMLADIQEPLQQQENKAEKSAKKALKKQKKAQKKLSKILKKSAKLARKQAELELRYGLSSGGEEQPMEPVQRDALH